MVAISAPAEVAVTGANGFIGSHICLRLLADGFRVRAVVRDAADAAKVAHLRALPGADSMLTCVSGSLVDAGGYDAAFAGCAAVVHTAAVVEVLDTSDAEAIVRPAVAGTRNVLASARVADVRRLVLVSSVAAVQSPYGKPDEHVYDEADWNEWSTMANDPYGYAKTQSEREAWAAVEGACFDVAALNPGVTLGPPLTKAHTKSSTVLVREVLYGNAMHAYYASFADVRDVAAAASAALTVAEAGGKRVIVVGEEEPMITTELGPVAQRSFPQLECGGRAKLYQWQVWLLARIGIASAFQESQATRRYHFSNGRLKELLGVRPRPLEETVRDAAQAMIDGGWVKARRKS